MARTNSTNVQGVLRLGSQGGDYDDANSPSLTPFIDTATAIVDRVNTCATDREVTLTTAELELIERWLAAHCYVQTDQSYASKSTAGASASFHGQTGMGLENSKYGQMALSLDPSGCLKAISQSRKVRAVWLGKIPSEQTDYVDRD